MSWWRRLRILWKQIVSTHMVTPEEIEGALHLPVLAVIPHLERRQRSLPPKGQAGRRVDLLGRWRSRLLVNFPSQAPEAKAYTEVARELQSRARTHRQKVWLVVSSIAGEGTSLTCVNLAIAAQRAGMKALVVEGHTRAPRISPALRLDLEPGLTGCLNRSLSPSQVIQKSLLAGMDVLPAGPSVAYPETLWGMGAFHRLLAEVRSLYEIVFFEGAPLLLYPDGAILADKTDGVLLVHQFGRMTAPRVSSVLETLGDRKTHVLGVLLNDAPVSLASRQRGTR